MTDWQGGSLVEFYRALLQCTSSSSYHRPRDTDPWKGGSSRDSCRPPHLGWPGGWGLLPPWRLEGRACPAAFSPLPTLEGARRPQPPDGAALCGLLWGFAPLRGTAFSEAASQAVRTQG